MLAGVAFDDPAWTVGHLWSSTGSPPAGPPWWFFLFVPVIWIAVNALTALCSGWVGLAGRFAAREAPVGERFRMQSVTLGLFGSYRNCVNVTVGPAGLHLVPMILFRFAHPAVADPVGDRR